MCPYGSQGLFLYFVNNIFGYELSIAVGTVRAGFRGEMGSASHEIEPKDGSRTKPLGAAGSGRQATGNEGERRHRSHWQVVGSRFFERWGGFGGATPLGWREKTKPLGMGLSGVWNKKTKPLGLRSWGVGWMRHQAIGEAAGRSIACAVGRCARVRVSASVCLSSDQASSSSSSWAIGWRPAKPAFSSCQYSMAFSPSFQQRQTSRP